MMSAGLVLAPFRCAESDRRANHRYPISMELTYRVVPKGKQARAGRTLDISSRGICCLGLEPLPARTKLEVSLSWPILLGSCPLKLVIVGRVLRSDAQRTAIAIIKHEFHTRRMPDAKRTNSAAAAETRQPVS
jgi:hypothetical protein